jgi:nucleoid DNA-binding protein/predicted GIY-YIG superfamily endonuclease
MPGKTWFVYLLECADGSLYTGTTVDIAARLSTHLSGKGARYTRSHKPLRLLASAPVGNRSEALKAELAIKRLPKDQKLPAVQSLASPSSHPLKRSSFMNKSELIEAIAKSAELTKADAERALNATIEAVVKTVAKGDTVTLVGFGTFKSSKRAARTGRNPATGAAIKIAASTVPRFTAGATFKTAVAGKKAKKK